MKRYHLELEWLGQRDFTTIIEGADPTYVGRHKPWPTHLLLEALAACGAMTLLDVLEKMTLQATCLNVEVTALRPPDARARFEEIHIRYILSGGPFPPDRMERALELADKYCTVRSSLHPEIRVTSSYEVQ